MKWIFLSVAVILTIALLFYGKDIGNIQSENHLSRGSKLAKENAPDEINSGKRKDFSWGMPRKKAFLIDEKKISKLPIEDSNISLDEILQKSRGDGVYAYRVWLLYFGCEKYIPLVSEEDSEEKKTLEACQLFVDKLITHQNELLYIAAKSGLPRARIDYFNYAFEDYDPNAISDENSQRIVAAKEAFSMVMDEANRGSVDAMLMVSGAYEIGVVVEKNPVVSYAFEYAAHKTGLLKNREEVLKLMEKYMTNKQINEAVERGNLILRSCCEE